MKFSSRGHYGLRAMLSLAQAYGEGPLSLAEIARAEKISLGYLEQLMAQLRKVGLVESIRGTRGGYRLTHGPSRVTVGEVLRALEGPIAPALCVSEESRACERESDCLSKVLWERLRDTVVHLLDSTTLADLCQGRERLETAGARE